MTYDPDEDYADTLYANLPLDHADAEEIVNGVLRQYAEPMVKLVWEWIINANNGVGGDVEDLIVAMNKAGFPCPEGVGDE